MVVTTKRGRAAGIRQVEVTPCDARDSWHDRDQSAPNVNSAKVEKTALEAVVYIGDIWTVATILRP